MATVQVLGRLTRDPQQRPVNQSRVVQVDIAESRKDRQGNEITAYYSASFWNKAGEPILQYFHKGDPIYVSGELEPREYQDRNGNNRISLDINLPRFKFVPAPPRSRNPQGYNNQQQGGYQQNNQSGYQQNNQQQPQGQPNNGYQQNPQPQQGQQQPPQLQQTQLGGNGWENTGAGQKRAQVNQQGQAQEISDDDLPFPTQNQETPF